jgi:hypothetical protein
VPLAVVHDDVVAQALEELADAVAHDSWVCFLRVLCTQDKVGNSAPDGCVAACQVSQELGHVLGDSTGLVLAARVSQS